MTSDEMIEARVTARIRGEERGLAGAALEQYVKTAVRNRFRNELRDRVACSQANFEKRMASFEGLSAAGRGVDRSDGGRAVALMVRKIDRTAIEDASALRVRKIAEGLPRKKAWQVAYKVLWAAYRHRGEPDVEAKATKELGISRRQFRAGVKKVEKWLSSNKDGDKTHV